MVASKVRFLATQAREPVRHYEHAEFGFNQRLSNVLAALASSQLATLEQRVARRRAIHGGYRSGLSTASGISLVDPLWEEDLAVGSLPTRWLTCLFLDPEANETNGINRDVLIDALEARNIESRPVWKPMHLQPIYRGAPLVGNGSVAAEAFNYGVALPSGSGLTDSDVDRVIASVMNVFAP